MKSLNEFTFRYYKKLLKYIGDNGSVLVPFRDYKESTKNQVILRHDIDYSILHALKLAEIEYSLDISATFFILISSKYYNVFEDSNVKAIKELQRMGHEIGLHYDSSISTNCAGDSWEQLVVSKIKLLESAFNITIDSISEHKPSESKVTFNSNRYDNAYSQKYVKEIPYVRDSAMSLQGIDLFKFFANQRTAQLLIHPIWWHEEYMTRLEIFHYLEEVLLGDIDNEIQNELKSIEEWQRRQILIYVPWKKPQYQKPLK